MSIFRAACELNERNLFDSSADLPARETRIVHDLTVTDVDSVVHVAVPGPEIMRSRLRFFTS